MGQTMGLYPGDDQFSAGAELGRMMAEEELVHAKVLVFCTKQDLPNAMSAEEISDVMDLPNALDGHEWHIQPCCGPTGEGLYEGLDWLAEVLED